MSPLQRVRTTTLHVYLATTTALTDHLARARVDARTDGERGSESLEKVIWIAVVATLAAGTAAALAALVNSKMAAVK